MYDDDMDLSDFEERQRIEDENDRLDHLRWEERKRACPVCERTFDGAEWDARVKYDAEHPHSWYRIPEGAVCPWLCGTESELPTRSERDAMHRRELADADTRNGVYNPHADLPWRA